MRLLLYTDSPVIGGGEGVARDLLASLGPSFETAVVGPFAEVVAHIASGRTGTETRVLPAVTGRTELSAIRAQAALIAELRPDVVHINQHLWSGQYGVVASALARVPCICVVHGVLPCSSRSQRYLSMAVTRLARAHVGVSGSVAASIVRELHVPAAHVRTIRNGISVVAESVEPQQIAARTVAGVGRLAWEKGFDLLIEALSEVPDCRLVLVGDGADRHNLEKLAARLGVSDRVEFRGWVSESWTRLLRPQVVAVPSRAEALSLVALEAMRAGLPIVATRVGGIPEVVIDSVTGVIVEPGNSSALAAGLRRVLDDASLAAAMGAAGRIRVREHFSLEREVAAYEHLYETTALRATSGSRRALSNVDGGSKSLESTGFGSEPESNWFHEVVRVLPPGIRNAVRSGAATGLRLVGTRSERRLDTAFQQFVTANIDAVKGDVLETRGSRFTNEAISMGARVGDTTVWDIEPRNLEATLVVDIAERDSLGECMYDCGIVFGAPWPRGTAKRGLVNLARHAPRWDPTARSCVLGATGGARGRHLRSEEPFRGVPPGRPSNGRGIRLPVEEF